MTENLGIRSVLWIANIDLQALQIWTAMRCVDVRAHAQTHAQTCFQTDTQVYAGF